MTYITESLFDDEQARKRLAFEDEVLGAIEFKRRELRTDERKIRQSIDEMRLQSKPGYPLPGHVTGIDEAVERVRRKVKANSHHGDPCAPSPNPYAVVAVGDRGFVSVRHLSPYSMVRRGSHLWQFTEADIQGFEKLFADFGATILQWWDHDEGRSFIIVVG